MRWSYTTRTEAGEKLIHSLNVVQFRQTPLVLAIPNGGVSVAQPIVDDLDADFDVLIVRKLQIPNNPEAGFGALTSIGTMILNDALVRRIGLSKVQIKEVRERTEKQIEERKAAYVGLVGHFDPSGREVILVDDGLASGFTMLAAIQSVRESNPSLVVVAVPTSSGSAYDRIVKHTDKLICPRVERGFVFAVANAYENWYDVPDIEVIEILKEYR